MKSTKRINDFKSSIITASISLGYVIIGWILDHLGFTFLSALSSCIILIILVVLQFWLFNKIKHSYGLNIKNVYSGQQNIDVAKTTYKNTIITYNANNNLKYLFCNRKSSYVLAIHSSLFKGIIILKGSKLASHKHDRRFTKPRHYRAIQLRNKYQNKLNFLRRKDIIKNRTFIQNTLLNTLSGAAGVICQAPAAAKNTWHPVTSPINIRHIKNRLRLNCDNVQKIK